MRIGVKYRFVFHDGDVKVIVFVNRLVKVRIRCSDGTWFCFGSTYVGMDVHQPRKAWKEAVTPFTEEIYYSYLRNSLKNNQIVERL